jgi:hypothetical protein
VDFEAQSGAADFETRRGSADFESQRESRDLGDRRAAADLEARRANADGADGADADGADTEDGAAAPAFLPRYEAAAAGDPSLPKLNLEFHAFAGDAARRFVYINGAKYSEGSSLGPRLRIARITADGVIVDAAGRQLLLPRK